MSRPDASMNDLAMPAPLAYLGEMSAPTRPPRPRRSTPCRPGAVGRRRARRLRGRGAALHPRGSGGRSGRAGAVRHHLRVPRWVGSTPVSSPAPPTWPPSRGACCAIAGRASSSRRWSASACKEFLTRAGHPARQRQDRGVRGAAAPGRHRADPAARARGAPPDPLGPHQPTTASAGCSSRSRSPRPTSARARAWCSCSAAGVASREWSKDPFVRAQLVTMGPSTRWPRRRCRSCFPRSRSASASSATAACARTRRCRRRCAWAPTRCW